MAPAPQRIVLIGFMGAGKSTVGPLVAARLGCRFDDLDARISTAEHASVPEIFSSRGEAEFRRLEAEHLQLWLEESPFTPGVLAVGGGAVESPDVVRLLGSFTGAIFYLEAPLAGLLERCRRQAGGTPRPLLAEAEVRFCRRENIYSRLGETVGTADRSPEEVAGVICARLEVPA